MRRFGLSWEAREALRVSGYTGREDLSGLIEAIGYNLMLTDECGECGEWEAWSNGAGRRGCVRMGESGARFECSGDTPEDAVAYLWIALNKKDA